MIIYRIDEQEFEDVDSVLDYCLDEDDYRDDDDDFEEWVNNKHDGATINGYDYSAYEIIRAMNDDNEWELKNQFCEERYEDDRNDYRYDLENAEDGDWITVHDYDVHVVEVPDEEEHKIEEVRTVVEQQKKTFQIQCIKEDELGNEALGMLEG